MMHTPLATILLSRKSRGFTLVELIAAMVIFGVIGMVLSRVILKAGEANNRIGTRGALYAEASAALDNVIRKFQTTPVRAASSPGVPAIASFQAALATWDDASQLDLSGGSIRLRDVQAGDPSGATPAALMDNVTAFTMTPYNESNANLFTLLGTSSLSAVQSAQIRRVEVTVTASREGQSVTLRSRAFVRAGVAGSAN